MPAQRSVARTGLLLAAVLALCRIASLGKELLVAGRFGAGEPPAYGGLARCENRTSAPANRWKRCNVSDGVAGLCERLLSS